MRTIIDLPDRTIAELDRIKAERGISRAALVREAVERYLAAQAGGSRRSAFGAWNDADDADGLAFQRRLRGEWDER